MSVNDDIALARSLLDPYLQLRLVGQHLSGDDADQLYKAGMACSMKETIQLNAHHLSTNQLEYWARKGLSQRQQPVGSGLWCDGSASHPAILSRRGPVAHRIGAARRGRVLRARRQNR